MFTIFVGAWDAERSQKREVEQTAIKLGVTPELLDTEEMRPQLIKLSSERFSNDLLSNRVSDLCGLLRTIWGWSGSLIQIGIFLGVVWFTVVEGRDNAVGAWSMVAVALFFWLSSVVFYFVCRLFTGRYPGQAKQARKSLAALIKQSEGVHA
jgi:hypothetical protein